MSIRDYNQKYILINGTTNEQIAIPKTNSNKKIIVEIDINEYLLLQSLTEELSLSDSVSVFKSYMKD